MKSLEEQLVELLSKKNYTVTTAESCTGGMIAGTIVNVPEEHLKFYIALDWTEVSSNDTNVPVATVTMYDAEGNSKDVPADKVEEYNGKKVIMEQVENGTAKKLIGIKMLDKSIARHEYEVYYNIFFIFP